MASADDHEGEQSAASAAEQSAASAAEQRDRAGHRRDSVAACRDGAAEQRDAEAENPADAPSPEVARRQAAADRRHSSEDRGAGSSERSDAELDRTAAQADREASARDRTNASVDGLTGAYLRGPGLVELEREMARARRTAQPLVLAFVDVDQLKAINDARGHASGDRALREVADALRARMRPYDLIMAARTGRATLLDPADAYR